MDITLKLGESQSEILCIMNELEGAQMTNEEFANDIFTNALIYKWLSVKQIALEQGKVRKLDNGKWEIIREKDEPF